MAHKSVMCKAFVALSVPSRGARSHTIDARAFESRKKEEEC